MGLVVISATGCELYEIYPGLELHGVERALEPYYPHKVFRRRSNLLGKYPAELPLAEARYPRGLGNIGFGIPVNLPHRGPDAATVVVIVPAEPRNKEPLYQYDRTGGIPLFKYFLR